jgi:UDP-GlcNAc:undecaprenyl-phosphate GlcNAc-1-phosphate transferase
VNYRGRRVTAGLGTAWLVWAVGLTVMNGVATSIAFGAQRIEQNGAGVLLEWFQFSPWGLASGFAPVLLTVGVLAFGLIDDVFGDGSAKGFRGHLAALREGHLTTGAFKLLGIGFLALAAATGPVLRSGRVLIDVRFGRWGVVLVMLVTWALAGAVIALSANAVNLLDLRPGRALKGYLVLGTVGIAVAGIALWTRVADLSKLLHDVGATPAVPVAAAAASAVLVLAVLAFGPVAAVWRLDLGERGMLGDAGANAMGALAGYLIAWSGNLWFLAAAAAALLAFNLASERVSFSRVIEERPLLRWIDGLGRIAGDGPPPDGEPTTGESGMTRDEVTQASSAGGADLKDDVTGKDGGS